MGERILYFLLVLAILIAVHEFGHFVAARWLKVRVKKFSLGFGPKVIGKKIGETEYLISAIPLGGYVSLLGEDPAEELTPEEKMVSFSSQTVGRRSVIVAAGPFFNLLLAFAIFILIAMIGFPVLTAQVGTVLKGSAAERAGLKENDVIVSIEGKAMTQWEEIRATLQLSRGAEVRMGIEREGRREEILVRPELTEDRNLFGESVKTWKIGISPKGTTVTKRYDPFSAVVVGWQRTWEITSLTVIGIGKLALGQLPRETIAGPIFIAQTVGEQASAGFQNVALLVAILSVNLGVLNLLPIPILDGGHLFFFSIEFIRGKPLSMRKREIAQQIGLVLLVSLMLLAFYNDIMRYFPGQG